MTVMMSDEEEEDDPPPRKPRGAPPPPSSTNFTPTAFGLNDTRSCTTCCWPRSKKVAVPLSCIVRRLQRRLSVRLQAPSLGSTGRVKLALDNFEAAALPFMLPAACRRTSTPSTTEKWVHWSITCMQIVLLAVIASKTFTGTFPVTGQVNLPVMLQCGYYSLHHTPCQPPSCTVAVKRPASNTRRHAGGSLETACQEALLQNICTATRRWVNRCAGTLVASAWITVMWLGMPELRPRPGSRDMNALASRHLSTIASTGRRAWSRAG